MKKVLTVLLCAVAAGTFAFADDAAPAVAAAPAADAAPAVVSKFNTTVATGINYSAGNNSLTLGEKDPTWFGQDNNTSRVDFSGSLSYGDIGTKVTLRNQSYPSSNLASNFNVNYWTVRRAYAYDNFFDSKVQLQFGRVGNGDFSTSYEGDAAFDNGDIGGLITVKPIEGLEVGYLLPANYIANNSETTTDAGRLLTGSTVAASYAIPGIATVQLWVRQFDNLAIVGNLEVTAVKNLDVTVEGYYNDPVDFGENGTLHFYETANYTVGKFTPGIVVWQYLSSKSSTDLGFAATPSIAYALTDKVSVAAEYTYSNKTEAVEDRGSRGVTDAYSMIDAYVNYNFGKGSLQLKPGFDTAVGKGFFVNLSVVASL